MAATVPDSTPKPQPTDKSGNCGSGHSFYPGGVGSWETNPLWPIPLTKGCYPDWFLPNKTVTKAVKDTTSVAEFLGKLTDPNFTLRVAEFGTGMLLLAIGVFVIVKGPQRVESTTRTAAKVASYTPQGRAASVTRKAQTAGKVAQHREYARQVGRAQGRVAAKKITAAKP